MLTITNLHKGYGTRTLFDGASLIVNRGERIGLIGRNGYGKSTLLRMISRKEAPDGGQIALEKDTKPGVLEQYFEYEHLTILEEAESVLPLLEGAYRETFKAERILEGLGFDAALRALSPDQLSGGFQVRLNLVKLLLSEPDILLLDEPTNYLDIISVRWLEQFLLEWEGASIVVSHDRTFIDKVSTHIALIYRQEIRKSAGTTQSLYEQIAEEESIHERTRKNQIKQRERQEDFIRTYRSKARQASRVQSKIKALERSEMLQKLEAEEDLSFSFSYEPFSPKWILHSEPLSFGYAKDPLFTELKVSINAKDRLAIIGANGRGKSTLLSLLYGALAPNEGSVDLHSAASVGYLGQSNIERLHPEKTVEESILELEKEGNRTRARSIAGCMLFSGDAAEKKIKVLSGGEKTRVHLGRIIVRPTNLLFLDEPTNHLDFYASQALLEALDNYPGAVVLVTHDEEFLRRIANRLIIFKNGSATLFDGSYDDFLRREGWDDEEGVREAPADDVGAATITKKELRHLKAEVNQQRSETIKPLRRAVSMIENEIETHEVAIKEEEQELLEITKEGFNDRAAKLSRSLSQRKEQIEILFEELETKSKELEEQESLFKARLSELSS